MDSKEGEFLKKLVGIFKEEAGEYVKNISLNFVHLQNAPSKEDAGRLHEQLFRETHSLKGAARSANFASIAGVCQALEDVFSALKKGEVTLDHNITGEVPRSMELVAGILAGAVNGDDSSFRGQAVDADRRIRGVLAAALAAPAPAWTREKAAAPAAPRPEEPAPADTSDTIRVSKSKLDGLLLEFEAARSGKYRAERRNAELRDLLDGFDAWSRDWMKADKEMRGLKDAAQAPARAAGVFVREEVDALLGFMAQTCAFVKAAEKKLVSLARTEEQEKRDLDGMLSRVDENAKEILMMPFSSIFGMLPVMVHNLARRQNKEVELVVEGDALDIDRRILENLKDPLVHMLNNSVDHGIETPEQRRQLGKPPKALIRIKVAAKNAGTLEITVSDDGRGLDAKALRGAAAASGLFTEGEAEKMSEAALYKLVFRSGVTTKAGVTETSGRGLGLAIAEEKIKKLGGAIGIESVRGKGVTFKALIPMKYASLKSVIVKAAGHTMALPSYNVETALRAEMNSFKTVGNRAVISIAGQTLPALSLEGILGIESPPSAPASSETGFRNLLVVWMEGEKLALLVDEILGEQEIKIKSMGEQLRHVKNVSGVATLAGGETVPVINVFDLFRTAVDAGPGESAVPEKKAVRKEKGGVLIADDSITTRVFLQNILESAGYRVSAAVDGLDALTLLKTEKFDLLVSDIDMPRLNGIDLTVRIREDKELSALPIVLVSALDSPEDRERGIDAGANAYIVKGSFDQANLLEVVKRFL